MTLEISISLMVALAVGLIVLAYFYIIDKKAYEQNLKNVERVHEVAIEEKDTLIKNLNNDVNKLQKEIISHKEDLRHYLADFRSNPIVVFITKELEIATNVTTKTKVDGNVSSTTHTIRRKVDGKMQNVEVFPIALDPKGFNDLTNKGVLQLIEEGELTPLK